MDERERALENLVQAEMAEHDALMAAIEFAKEHGRTLLDFMSDVGVTTDAQFNQVVLTWELA